MFVPSLKRGEKLVVTVKYHPAMISGPIFSVLFLLAVAGFVSQDILRGNPVGVIFVWVVWGVFMVRLASKIVEWSSVGYFVITSHRILLVSSDTRRKHTDLPFSKTVTELPLAKVTNVRLRRSSKAQILGYGELVFESVLRNQELLTIDYVPYPEQVFQELLDVISPNRKDSARQAGQSKQAGALGSARTWVVPGEAEVTIGPDQADATRTLQAPKTGA